LLIEDLAEARLLVAASPLFVDVPCDELDATCQRLRTIHFGRGEIVVQARELGDCCYIIRSGDADVLSDDLIGKETRINSVGPGDLIGEIALLKDVLRVATVKAVTEVDAFVLDRDSFLELSETVPVFARRLRKQVEQSERVLFLRRASPFATLSADSCGQLAEALRQVTVQAGEVVVREGDQANGMYLIRSGRFEVLRDGRLVQELATGDYFGEMALLTKRRRNATVRALEDGELLVLRRQEFDELVGTYQPLRNHFDEMKRARDGQSPGEDDEAGTDGLRLVRLPAERRAFWLTLALGLVLFTALDALARVSQSFELSIAVLLVGAVVGPASYVVYLSTTNVLTREPRRLTTTFVIAGASLPLAYVVERALGTLGFLNAFTYALVEEPIKVLAIVWLLRRSDVRFQMDGVIYGAAAGMGFAALEAVDFGLRSPIPVSGMLDILWLRALLSPFNHGTWTAIVCAALWQSRYGDGRYKYWQVGGAFAMTIGLHAAWDWLPVPPFLYYYYYMGIGIVGLAVLGLIVKRARSEQERALAKINPGLADGGWKGKSLICRGCRHRVPGGARYCPRCGLAQRL
jgi:CRP-like cAMP-binding protein/RsiW-degrading membrane proteinase PrsW (M82 family)